MQLATCSWVCNEGSSMIQRWHIGGTESWSARRTWWRILRLKVLKLCWKRSKEHAKRQNMPKVIRTSAGLKSHHAAQSHITQCNCEMGEVTSYSGKSHHFVTIPQAQRHLTENRKVSQFSRDIAHSEIYHDFYKQVCNEYQWHSVCLIWPFDAVWFEWFEFECRLMWESPWTPKLCSDCPTFKAPTVSRCSAMHDCESPEIRLMVTLTLDSSLAIVQNGGAPESGPLSHSATLRGQKVFQNIQLKNIKKTLCIIWRRNQSIEGRFHTFRCLPLRFEVWRHHLWEYPATLQLAWPTQTAPATSPRAFFRGVAFSNNSMSWASWRACNHA